MTKLAETIPTVTTFRDRMRERWSLPWQQTGNNWRFLYAIALCADVLGDALVAGIASRLPGVFSAETLPVIGRERRIARGPYETDAGYAARLRRWLDDHRRRGGAYAMLAQIHAYFAPNNFPVTLIYRSGRRYDMAPDGTIARSISSFEPDAEPEKWARWWLFYTTDEYDAQHLTAEDVADLTHVPREWNAAHTTGTIVLRPPGGELYNWPVNRPYNRPGTPYNMPSQSVHIPVD